MNKFKITVNVDICESDEKREHGPRVQQNGAFSMTINEKDAVSIDNCEKAVLTTINPAIRESVAKHLSEVSKKKPSKKHRN
ncbi:MAG: hypothetical protein GY834_10030 [Bacteroidetes bacterium]|nr:hypothetical protein [Bacteroidota bacterium]